MSAWLPSTVGPLSSCVWRVCDFACKCPSNTDIPFSITSNSHTSQAPHTLISSSHNTALHVSPLLGGLGDPSRVWLCVVTLGVWFVWRALECVACGSSTNIFARAGIHIPTCCGQRCLRVQRHPERHRLLTVLPLQAKRDRHSEQDTNIE